jgi:RNA polymerase sigma-B factor
MSPLVHNRTNADRSLRTAELFDRCRGDLSADDRRDLLNQVVEVNLGVADALAARYARRGLPEEDLAQVARMALVRASRAFRPDLGCDFLSYAVPCIRGELRRHFRDTGWMVRPPRRVQEAEYRIHNARARLTDVLDREPTAEDYAHDLDLDEATVVEALTLNGCFQPDSLDRPANQDSESASTVGERLGSRDPGFDRAENRVVLEPLIASLPPRDRMVLRLRFAEQLTQREVGNKIGVTQMQVSRILTRILGQLRDQLSGDHDRFAATG